MNFRRNNYMLLAEEAYIEDNKDKSLQFYKKALNFEGIGRKQYLYSLILL